MRVTSQMEFVAILQSATCTEMRTRMEANISVDKESESSQGSANGEAVVFLFWNETGPKW